MGETSGFEFQTEPVMLRWGHDNLNFSLSPPMWFSLGIFYPTSTVHDQTWSQVCKWLLDQRPERSAIPVISIEVVCSMSGSNRGIVTGLGLTIQDCYLCLTPHPTLNNNKMDMYHGYHQFPSLMARPDGPLHCNISQSLWTRWINSPSGDRSHDLKINSLALYQLSYQRSNQFMQCYTSWHSSCWSLMCNKYVWCNTKGLIIAKINWVCYCQPARGVEPQAFSLRMKCPTTELYGRRGCHHDTCTSWLHWVSHVHKDSS